MSQLDQPRPDLDAALDAVIPSLTAVDDDAAASSLRHTRLALADGTTPANARGWRWALPAAAAVTVAIVAAVVFWPRTPVTEPTRVAVKTTVPAPPALPVERPPVSPTAPAPPPVQPTRAARAPQIAATSAPRPDEPPRPDPLIALVRAVQEIPEDAWTRGTSSADVSVAPLAIAPLETPALPDPPSGPSLGEP